MQEDLSVFKIPQLNEFDFKIKYDQKYKSSHTFQIDLHTHREFEIYINLSGDISFLVENELYPLSRGDIIIVQPGQAHHCVYRSDKKHSFFWILFNLQNNPLLKEFVEDNINTNYISPSSDLKEELIELCMKAAENKIEESQKFYYFFRLLYILKTSSSETTELPKAMPDELTSILNYIDSHLSENLKVSDIAKALYISESTIRRRFKEYININPLLFIQKRKLHYATTILKNGESVLNAGFSVGYTDNSYFIGLFKRQYGITPYQYKQKYNK